MLLFPAGYFHFSKKAASDACGYPDSPTRLLRAAPPSPLGTQIFNLWLRVLRTLLTATSSPLAVVFFFFSIVFRLHIQEPVYISFGRQKLPHFFTGAPVFRVGFLLFF